MKLAQTLREIIVKPNIINGINAKTLLPADEKLV